MGGIPFLFLFGLLSSMVNGHNDPTPVMIQNMGYPVEVHSVTTLDGYILEMHRIPSTDTQPAYSGKPVVYLQHGLLCSSADWVMGDVADKFLGYILADAGYDVWMGNYRGNTYSRNHVILNPDTEDFWKFSWDQVGKLDIPAQIDKITSVTGENRMHYVGHSMGTTGMMVMLNELPEYESRIIMANFLAPVAYVDHMKSPIRYLAPFTENVEWIVDHLGDGEFLPSSELMDWLAANFCDSGWTQVACESVMFLLMGFDKQQMNDTLLPTIMSHSPAGASTFMVLQYAQEVTSTQFCQYDRYEDNNIYYGSPTPPLYDAQYTLPISLYWSQNDWLAQPQDVSRIRSSMLNLFDDYEVPFAQWNHLDYLWAVDANRYVYDRLVQNINSAQSILK